MADHLVDGRIGLDVEELRDIERADLGDTGDIVAQEIDDHAVFRLRLDIAAHGLDDFGILGGGGAAFRRALHRMGLDPALFIGAEEQFRRPRQDERAAEIDERAVFDRLAFDQRPEGGTGIAVPAGLDRHGEVRLIGVAEPQVLMQTVEALFIYREIPGGLRGGEELFVFEALFRLGKRVCVRLRSIEDAEGEERGFAIFPSEGGEFLLEQISGLVGDIAGEPFALGFGLFHSDKAGKEFGARSRDDDLRRFGEKHHLA